MPEAAAILARLDAIMAELAELRAQVAGADTLHNVDGIDTTADDFSPENLIEISTAVSRFNRPGDTIRYWCRQEGDGKKIAGRWWASAPRLQRRLNGG